jgi:hypothetical protein
LGRILHFRTRGPSRQILLNLLQLRGGAEQAKFLVLEAGRQKKFWYWSRQAGRPQDLGGRGGAGEMYIEQVEQAGGAGWATLQNSLEAGQIRTNCIHCLHKTDSMPPVCFGLDFIIYSLKLDKVENSFV